MTKQVKPAATINQHVDLLQSRGMEVDPELARQWLANVSYYRLSAYWYPGRIMRSDGYRGDDFVPGTTFKSAVDLYEADRKLRTLVHDGMERIEITMRTRIGEALCVGNPMGYADSNCFRPSFDHQKWMSTVNKRISRAGRNNEAIKHYQVEYDGKYPFWVLAEVLDFADVSRLFEGLPANNQLEISEGLNIKIDLDDLSKNQQRKAKSQPPLVRWMEQLTVIRNICAHHGRLWNKSFAPAPTAALRTQPEFALLPENQSQKVFGALTVMAYLLRITSPGTSWPRKVTLHIKNSFLANPLVQPESLGLPASRFHSL
ncbi:Abi family protein [Mobiluncus curtisii]|uniref:Abi family protein n=1 Tax=Mobiluncus curtisii TaxID=2051 RepID=UPI0018C8C1BD|nr:Abi family protein [Mobiluncus curtisii]